MPGVLHKPVRENIIKILAHSLKPPVCKEDKSGGENHQFFAVYVSDGVEHKEPCTQRIWRMILGPKSRPGSKVPGLDNRTDEVFFLIKDRKTGVITGLDRVPENKYAKGMVPEKFEGLETMEIQVNVTTGEYLVKQIPPKTRDSRIRHILDALDKKTTVVPGEEIEGCEVVMASGNLISISIPKENEGPTG